MRLALIVTEYPKITETFILRDVLAFLDAGVEVRIYHLAPFRRNEILHDFARPTLRLAHSGPQIAATRGKELPRARRPRAVAREIFAAYRSDPLLMAKSLALIPMSMALASDMLDWGAEHVHAEFAGHPATAAWIIHRATGLPYSVSCRAHDVFRTQQLLNSKLGEASFVRTVSEFGKAFLLNRVAGLSPDKLSVIHSSVNLDHLRKLPPPSCKPFHIVYVGSLQVRKGIDVLLKALVGLNLPDWKCSIAGDGPERANLGRLCHALGLDNRVSFLGRQGFEAVTQLYEAASIVVAPSIIGPQGRTEGIPNVMIEALALQRPVISTRVSGIPELVKHGETGLLTEPGAIDELRLALRRVALDPDEAYRMARAGRGLVENAFDIRKNAQRQLELFERYGRVCLPKIA